MNNKNIGKTIKKKRIELGITQAKFGEILGVSDKTVSKWECGNSLPDISILKNICKTLNISFDELLDGNSMEKDILKCKKSNNIISLIIVFILIIIILVLFCGNRINNKNNLQYECVLTKTYSINKITKSNDENYIYVTINEFQTEGTFTIKLSKILAKDLQENENYEFTFNTHKNIVNETTDIIFSNSEIINIVLTNKIGLEQSNNYMCNNKTD